MNITFKTEGMACQHCENRVKALLEQIPGVSGVEASAETGMVSVTADENVTKDMVKETILDAGFDVVE